MLRPPSLTALLQAGMRASVARSAWQFEGAARAPERAQQERLHAVLKAVSGSGQAERLGGLEKVRTAREFQDAVPLGDSAQVAADVEALKAGELRALTDDPPLRFELSGGSSGASKYVPMTRGLLDEFQRALSPWLHDLLTARPALRRGPSYWSISPLGARGGRTAGGTPIGSASDSSYFPALLRPLVDRVLAVPGEVALLPDVDTCRYVTLRFLLARSELAFLSVWNPSFLTLMFEALEHHGERLLLDLQQGTCRPPAPQGPALAAIDSRMHAQGVQREAGVGARLETDLADAWRGRVQQVLERLRFAPEPAAASRLRRALALPRAQRMAALWPGLALVSCWTDADAARALPPLRAHLGGIEIQGKGLLATEGVVTLPRFDAPAPVLAVRSHFYEFLEERAEGEASVAMRPLLAHELEVGRTYRVLFSTSGGLLRYRLGDRVRVEGHWQQTPCLRLVGRADSVVDLVGEKLSVARASEVLGEVVPEVLPGVPLTFTMLAPEWTAPPAYHLYVEAPEGVDDQRLAHLAARVDAVLCEGHAYGYARQLGQLGPVKAVRVRDGAARYEARCIALGQRAGDIKPTPLHREPGWRESLRGAST